MKIKINNLVVMGCHGVYEKERTKPQPFKIDAEVELFSSIAGDTDVLEDTLNWAALKEDVVRVVAENSFFLVEKLTTEIARTLKEKKGVKIVRVEVGKLNAFGEPEKGYPSVEVEI